jgi:hypothetical protein
MSNLKALFVIRRAEFYWAYVFDQCLLIAYCPYVYVVDQI